MAAESSDTPPLCASDRKTQAALVFALVAERLSIFYEHSQWLSLAQGATLAAEWLSRAKLSLATGERKRLSELSDRMARQIGESLSREAGLHVAHEMMESLDPRYQSAISPSLLEECERLLEAEP